MKLKTGTYRNNLIKKLIYSHIKQMLPNIKQYCTLISARKYLLSLSNISRSGSL